MAAMGVEVMQCKYTGGMVVCVPPSDIMDLEPVLPNPPLRVVLGR